MRHGGEVVEVGDLEAVALVLTTSAKRLNMSLGV